MRPAPTSPNHRVVSALLCQTLQEPRAIWSATCLLGGPGRGTSLHSLSVCHLPGSDGAVHAARRERGTGRRRTGLGTAGALRPAGVPTGPQGPATGSGKPECRPRRRERTNIALRSRPRHSAVSCSEREATVFLECLLYAKQLARPTECLPSGRDYSTLQIRSRRSEVVGDIQTSEWGLWVTSVAPRAGRLGGERALGKCTELGRHRAVARSLGQSPALLAHGLGSAPPSPPSPAPNAHTPLQPCISEGCCRPAVGPLPVLCGSLCTSMVRADPDPRPPNPALSATLNLRGHPSGRSLGTPSCSRRRN